MEQISCSVSLRPLAFWQPEQQNTKKKEKQTVLALTLRLMFLLLV